MLRILLVLFALATVAFGQTAYIDWGGAQLLTEPGGDVLGTVAVTSPVEVLEQGDGHSHIRFEGFVNPAGSSPAAVYTNPNDSIVMFIASDSSALPVPTGATDWTPVTLEGWVEDGQLVTELAGLFETAAERYRRYCSQCHVGYAGPVEDLIRRLKPHEWPSIANRMRMGLRISDEDFDLVLHWLQTSSQEAWRDR